MYKFKYFKYKTKYLTLSGGYKISEYFEDIYIPDEYNDLLIDYEKYLKKEIMVTSKRKYIVKMTITDIPIEISGLIINVRLPNLYFYNSIVVPLYKKNFGTFMGFISKYITINSNIENISCLFKQLFFNHFAIHNKIEYRNFMLFIKPDEINKKYQKLMDSDKLVKQPHITVVQKCYDVQDTKPTEEKIFMDTIYLLFYWSVILNKYNMTCDQYYNVTAVGDYINHSRNDTNSHSRIIFDNVNQMVKDINDFIVKENLIFCRPHYDSVHMQDQLGKKNDRNYSLVIYFYVYRDNKIVRYIDYNFRLSSSRFVKNIINYPYNISIKDLILRLFYNSEFLFVFDNTEADHNSDMYEKLLFIDETYIKNQTLIIPKILNYVSIDNIYDFSCIYKYLYKYLFQNGTITYKNLISGFNDIFKVKLQHIIFDDINASNNNIYLNILKIILYCTHLLDQYNYDCDDLLKEIKISIDKEIIDELYNFMDTL